MGLQSLRPRLMWVGLFIVIVAGIGLILRLIHDVSSGRGLEMYRGGTRMLPLMPVAVLITLGVVAIALLIAAMVGWHQRRHGWSDDDNPRS